MFGWFFSRFAFGEHPLFDLEPQRPLDQRLVLAEIQIVSVRPVDAPDLVDVAETLGNKECGLGAFALQNGIDGDGRAMEKQAGGLVAAAGLFDPGIDAFDQTVRCRQRLAECQLAGSLVEDRDVGEGAADIGRKTKVRAVGSGANALLHVPVSDGGGRDGAEWVPSPSGKGTDLRQETAAGPFSISKLGRRWRDDARPMPTLAEGPSKPTRTRPRPQAAA